MRTQDSTPVSLAQLDSRAAAVEQWRAMDASLSSRLAGITLPDADSLPVQLGSLWADRPAVVVFLRHYG